MLTAESECIQHLRFKFPVPDKHGELITLELFFAGGQVLNVLFAAIIGGFALGMAAPNIQHFVAGCSAFGRLKKVLDR